MLSGCGYISVLDAVFFAFANRFRVRFDAVFSAVLLPFCYRSDHRFLDNANGTETFP